MMLINSCHTRDLDLLQLAFPTTNQQQMWSHWLSAVHWSTWTTRTPMSTISKLQELVLWCSTGSSTSSSTNLNQYELVMTPPRWPSVQRHLKAVCSRLRYIYAHDCVAGQLQHHQCQERTPSPPIPQKIKDVWHVSKDSCRLQWMNRRKHPIEVHQSSAQGHQPYLTIKLWTSTRLHHVL